ncbi:MAG TPA: Uma2 family endonuclease [Isosphaeraceae bacterium]|nr:Uma2 family endonuclease [Isosphaeraceae bacterium]
MATTPKTIDYPTGDGKPLAETPIHRDNLLGLIEVLRRHFAGAADVYISGNMMMYYVEGDKRRHVSPDVFVVRGIRGANDRDAYFVWEEGKGPDFVVEFTSKSTRREDLRTKFELYRDVLHVEEYFLFDPKQEYLKPSMQGFRLVGGAYEPIEPVAGRLPSVVTGLHLERDGTTIRMYDPATGRRVPTPAEAEAESRAAAETLRRELEELRAQHRQRNGA